VESAASKNKLSGDFDPRPSLLNLVYRWARRPACSFAADILNSCFVVAREMGLDSAFHLCNLRGWIVTLPTLRRVGSTVPPFNIEHKRFHECLKMARFPPGHRGLNLLGIVKSACDILETSVLPSSGETASTKMRQPRTKSKTTPISSAKKRTSARASPHFELVHAHDPAAFQVRLTHGMKCLQIALFYGLHLCFDHPD
jgi:hypothetical protein